MNYLGLLSRTAGAIALAALGVGLGLTGPAPKQALAQPKPADALPADLALVPADALGFVHVRLADVWKHDSLKPYRRMFEKAGPNALAALDEQFVPPPSSIDRITTVILTQKERPEPSIIAILAFSQPFEPAKVQSAYLTGVKPQAVGGKEYFGSTDSGMAVHFPDNKTLVIGDVKTMPVYLAMSASGEGGLRGALDQAAGNQAVFAAVNVKALPLPPEFTDHVPPEFQPLLKTEYATVTIDLAQQATLKARLVYANGNDAQEAEKSLRRAAEMGRQALAQPRQEAEKMLYKKDSKGPRPLEELPEAIGGVAMHGVIATIDEILADLPVTRDGSTLAAEVALPQWTTAYLGMSAMAVGLALPAVQKVREAAARTQSQNNLKQIGLAMHIHHDALGAMPPAAIVGKDGKRLLSWRVAILPYIEQENLYKQFKLDEPWDSEHNKKLIPLMPRTYADPRLPAEPGKTFYKVIVGKEAGFDWVKARRFPADYPDGTSNTIMTVAAGDPVIWTKPEDIEFDSGKELPELFKPFNVLLTGFFDGSVRTVNPNVDRKTLKHLIMRNDGMAVGYF